jgi:hypothetical protein
MQEGISEDLFHWEQKGLGLCEATFVPLLSVLQGDYV